MADSVLAEAFPRVRAKKDGATSRSRAVDLTGRRFHLLTVVGRAPNQVCASGKQRSVWNCVCDCGGTKAVPAAYLRDGAVKSCGCHKPRPKVRSPQNRKGMSYSAEYRSWIGAKKRTTNQNNRDYPRYGGRGIIMCHLWVNDFDLFLADMGPRPPGTSLDRIDNNGPYSKGNCRWATPVEQARNRRSSILYSVGNDEKTLTEWSKVSGIPEPRIWKRVNTLGWPPERAIFEPILKR